MPDPSTTTTTNTLKISRILKAPRERVYNAFLDPDAMGKWLPPAGFTGKVHDMDSRVGGKWRMSFTSLDKSWTQAFGGEYLELEPYERIRYEDNFETDDPAMQGTIIATITLKEVPEGTEITVVQEGLPKVIPLEEAMAGWGQSLENLARLIEL